MKERSLFFLVPTPLGNLEDITLRAIRVLREVDLILAEDTRNTSVILRHYSIRNRLKSFHAFNEHRVVSEIIDELKKGHRIALVTDAGTPGISDPGYLLVKACIENHIPYECLPGPSALIPALVVSGLPSDSFVFFGFLPVKKGRNKMLDEIAEESRTMIFYESPHKIIKTISDFTRTFGGNRHVSIVRELSKLHEEVINGNLESIGKHFEVHPPKGELVIVLAGRGR